MSTGKGKVRPRTSQEGLDGEQRYLYSFFDLGARCWWVVKATPLPLYPWERHPVPIAQEAGWVPGSV